MTAKSAARGPATTQYRVLFGRKIERVTVVQESKFWVTLRERDWERKHRRSVGNAFFQTYPEARDYVIERARADEQTCMKALMDAQERVTLAIQLPHEWKDPVDD